MNMSSTNLNMSSTNLQTCVFCTFVNVPGSKNCLVCQKSLPTLPKVKVKVKVKVCPACSLFNETFYDTCQICGTELSDDSKSGIESDCGASASKQNARVTNVCSKCCQKYPGDVFVMVCPSCTYYNLADTVQCLICMTRYESKQKAVLSKVCPYCNHDETAVMGCENCTFHNSMQNVYCAMCGGQLQKSVQTEDIDSSHKSIDKKAPVTDRDKVVKASLKGDEDEFSIENMRFEFAEGVSIRNGSVRNIANSVYTNSITSTTSKAPGKTNPNCEDSFEILEMAPRTHKYFDMKSETKSPKFMRAVASNIEILKSSAPSGVWIKCYEDRMDLLSFMIEGPHSTPYENGLFIFDIHLPAEFPMKPPIAHYISFWGYRLNPNLYVEGKVCVSLLGTWYAERKEEQWRPTSTLLQLIVSIQGLILVEQPYFNEPGYANQLGTPEGFRNSAMYNEGVIVGMIDSTAALINDPPLVFKKEIFQHFSECGATMYERLKTTIGLMENPPSSRQLERLRLAIQNNVNANVK